MHCLESTFSLEEVTGRLYSRSAAIGWVPVLSSPVIWFVLYLRV